MDAIMKLYSQENKKQIFISFDELADYSPTTQKIAEEYKVLTLSPGGNELFGISWSKKKTENIIRTKIDDDTILHKIQTIRVLGRCQG